VCMWLDHREHFDFCGLDSEMNFATWSGNRVKIRIRVRVQCSIH